MFAKVFEQIYDSSIAEDYLTRLVFEDLLVLANCDGEVDRTREAIARRTNVPLDIVYKAIETLEKKDPSSRSPEYEGRRLIRLDGHRDWGWKIVNYNYYRDLASESQRREKGKERVRKFRERKKQENSGDGVTPCNASVTHDNDSPSASVYASESDSGGEGEGERGDRLTCEGSGGKDSEKMEIPPKREDVRAYSQEISFLEWNSWYDHFESNGWKVGGKTKMRDWKAALRNAKRRGSGTGPTGSGQQSKQERKAQEDKQIRQYAEDLRCLRESADLIGDPAEAESKFWTKIKDLYGKNFPKAKTLIQRYALNMKESVS